MSEKGLFENFLKKSCFLLYRTLIYVVMVIGVLGWMFISVPLPAYPVII